MTAPLQAIAAEDGAERWSWPISPPRDDAAVAVRPAEARAVANLGVRNFRRLQYHDPSAPGWRVITRLLVPLEAVNAALDSPPTPHRRRAMLDVVAMLLTRCAETGRTFWGWTEEEWFHLLGRTQTEFRRHAPAWTGDEVRPYLAAHSYLRPAHTHRREPPIHPTRTTHTAPTTQNESTSTPSGPCWCPASLTRASALPIAGGGCWAQFRTALLPSLRPLAEGAGRLRRETLVEAGQLQQTQRGGIACSVCLSSLRSVFQSATSTPLFRVPQESTRQKVARANRCMGRTTRVRHAPASGEHRTRASWKATLSSERRRAM